MWVAVTPQTLLVKDRVYHPGYLIYIVMYTRIKTADAAEIASTREIYFRPILVAKVKDLLFRLLLNVLPNIPPNKIIWYDGAIESITLLTFYVSQIEDDQHEWASHQSNQ